MSLLLLHLDEALKTQPHFVEYCRSKNAREADFAEAAKNFRLWGKQKDLADFRTSLKTHINKDSKPLITFTGSGDFHHITQVILSLLMEGRDEKITVIHFDNHPDWVHFDGGMHCGSWVNRALEIPNVEKVITLGVCSKDLKMPEFKGANLDNLKNGKIVLFPYSHKPSFVYKQYQSGASYSQEGYYINWDNIENHPHNFIENLLPQITTKLVYITIDKDVLDARDTITNWDQGKMRLPFLLDALKTLTKKFDVLGVDVIGDYSKKNYAGTKLDVLKKHAETIMDQPRVKTPKNKISEINTASNMAIINVLEGFL